MQRRWIGRVGVAVLLLLFPLAFKALAQADNIVLFTTGQNTYTVGDQVYTMDTAPFIQNGRTYVPMRFLANALGVPNDHIWWGGSSEQIILQGSGHDVGLTLGDHTMSVDGDQVIMDVPPIIVSGRTFLPARWVADAFGATVNWNPTNRRISITMPPPADQGPTGSTNPATVTTVSAQTYASPGSIVPIAAPDIATVTLRLKAGALPGTVTPMGNSNGLPPDLPPGTPVVSLPLLPGSVPTTAKVYGPAAGYPGSPYLKAATAAYLTPESIPEVEEWFHDKLLAMGYQQTIDGATLGNLQTGLLIHGLAFTNVANPYLTVEMDFQSLSGKTLIRYWAMLIDVPARPKASFIPKDVNKVTIVAWPNGTGLAGKTAPIRRTITDQGVLAQFVAAVNSLPVDTSGPNPGGPNYDGEGATISFFGTHGISVVNVNPVFRSVKVNDRYELFDQNILVWKTAMNDIGYGHTAWGLSR